MNAANHYAMLPSYALALQSTDLCSYRA